MTDADFRPRFKTRLVTNTQLEEFYGKEEVDTKLDELFKGAAVVYSPSEISTYWDKQKMVNVDRIGIVCGIRPVEKKCEKHEVISFQEYYANKSGYSLGDIGPKSEGWICSTMIELSECFLSWTGETKCKHCGVKLKAEWKKADE